MAFTVPGGRAAVDLLGLLDRATSAIPRKSLANICSCIVESVNAQRDGKVRYIVHFAEGGSGMRWCDKPLEEAGTLTDGGVEYSVTRVDGPQTPGGLGHAWVRLA